MKTQTYSLRPRGLACSLAAALALFGMVALTAARASEGGKGQSAEVLALLTAVHELTSYNGDADTRSQHLAAWEKLWAEDATFVINGTTTISGRDNIMVFFAGASFFNNNWVGLTPSFRTEVAIHGGTAEVYLECVFLNEAKAVVLERALSGTLRKISGQWYFWHMKNDPAVPLFP